MILDTRVPGPSVDFSAASNLYIAAAIITRALGGWLLQAFKYTTDTLLLWFRPNALFRIITVWLALSRDLLLAETPCDAKLYTITYASSTDSYIM